MRKKSVKTIVPLIMLLAFSVLGIKAQERVSSWFQWSTLPSLPDSLGLGGAFAGKSNGVLIVAGGSNFEKPIWKGGKKAFHRAIYVLEKTGAGEYLWHRAGTLPYAVSNGACVNTSAGMLCMGGTDGVGDLDKVIQISWDPIERKIRIDDEFPPLPQACSYLSAAISENCVYVAGGKNADNPNGMDNFWALQLSSDTRHLRWKILARWPGAERFGAVLVAQSNGEQPCIFLFSGKSGTDYLVDGYEYNPAEEALRQSWTRKGNLPRAAMVAPSTRFGQEHIVVLSGSDGHDTDRIFELKERYAFSNEILSYHPPTDRWEKVGELPVGIVTTNVVWWDGLCVIPGGEIGPGRRTNMTFAGQRRAD